WSHRRLPDRRPFKKERASGRRPAGRDKAWTVSSFFPTRNPTPRSGPPGSPFPGLSGRQKPASPSPHTTPTAGLCTASRPALLTGLQRADNKMFDNCDCPWQPSLSPEVPTIGDMLRKTGYYTAYKGKWHLNGTFDSHQPTKLFTKEMEEYGFADYASP